jgi:hypothetical protein
MRITDGTDGITLADVITLPNLEIILCGGVMAGRNLPLHFQEECLKFCIVHDRTYFSR